MFKLYYTTQNNIILRCGRKLQDTDDNDKTIIDKCIKLLSDTGKQYNYYKVHKNNIIKDIFDKNINIQDKSGTTIDFTQNIDSLVSSASQGVINIGDIFDKGVVDKIMDQYTSDTNQFHEDIELNTPEKKGCYIWWVYPQLESINYFLEGNKIPSDNTKKYGFDSIYTAFRYLLSNYTTFKKNYDVISNNPDFFKTGTLPDDIQKFDSSIKLFMLVAKMIQNEELLQYLQEILNIFYKNNTANINDLKKANITQQVIDKQYLLIGNNQKTGDEKLLFDGHILKMKFVEKLKETSDEARNLKTNYYHPVNILFQENFKIVKAGILDELREIDATISSPFNDVIVDPAKNDSLTGKLSGGYASGAIYKMYEIYNAELNTDTNNILKANNNFESDKFLFIEKSQTFENGGLIRTAQYKNKGDNSPIVNINEFKNESKNIIIHVVGPRKGEERRFLDILIYCYEQVFLQFINIIKITKRPLTLRLLPISGGVFSITDVRASKVSIALFCIARAYDNLTLDDKFELDKSTIKLCIYKDPYSEDTDENPSEQTLFTKLHKDIKKSTEHLYKFFSETDFLKEFLTDTILQKLINPELST